MLKEGCTKAAAAAIQFTVNKSTLKSEVAKASEAAANGKGDAVQLTKDEEIWELHADERWVYYRIDDTVRRLPVDAEAGAEPTFVYVAKRSSGVQLGGDPNGVLILDSGVLFELHYASTE